MITIQYHPELIEQTVWLAVRRDATAENELHQAIDPVFELPQDDEREATFRRTFVGWFTRMGLDRFLDETLTHFPRIVAQVEEGLVRAAPRRKSQGAELFVRDEADGRHRTLVVQVCPESLIDPQHIRDAMLRELQHVEDMLDEAFGYVPESIDGLPSQQQVVRDRYGILWCVRVETTLARLGLLSCCNERGLRRQFDRAFTVAGMAPPAEAFAAIWDRQLVPHSQLLAWATSPRAWLQQANNASSPGVLGEPCPICGFPTFDWFDRLDFCNDDLISRVRLSFSDWTLEDGICRQCAETFLSKVTVQTS